MWISEIMLQQTRVEAVKGYYARFLARLPDLQALASVSEDELLKLWEGLGYYNRARNLKRAANQILTERNGVFPKKSQELTKIVGIGPYTAGAIASICFDEKEPAVDGNVLRVWTRVFADPSDISLPATKARITDALRAIYPDEAGDFTQAIMELGATVCVPNGEPHCAGCPLACVCQAHKDGITDALPVKAKTKARKIVQKTVFLLEVDGKLAIEQRADKGLLAGMWQFPNIDEGLSVEDAIIHAEKFDVIPREILRSVERTHIFTHIEWRMCGVYLACRKQSEAFTWASPEELAERYALPTAFRIFLEQ